MFADRQAADTRVMEDSDYYLPKDFVDQFATGRSIEKAPPVGLSEDMPDEFDVPPTREYIEDDPTDGIDPAVNNGLETCVKNWKAAAADEKKRTWDVCFRRDWSLRVGL